MYSKITQDAIARFGDITVLVAGDFMLDRFIYGNLERISPEAPIPILQGHAQERMLGGAGNVVANVISLGARAISCTVLGSDPAGAQITAMLSNIGANVVGVRSSPSRQSTRKSRYIAQKQQVLRYDEENPAPLTGPDRDWLIESWPTELEKADIVILSDYGKGILANGIAQEIIQLCRRQGKPVLVDPKGTDYSIYHGATAVSPNRRELHEATGCPVRNDAEIEAAARQLVNAHRFAFVLATRSEEGMSIVSSDAAYHIPTRAQEVYDVSGAGDTVIASFALAHAAGLDMAEAAELCNAAAGIAVAKRGTAQVTREELSARLSGRSDEIPVLNREAIVSLVTSWKDQGRVVGFTNGCFDILHTGHISLLQQARNACDRLVVGLNSDASVKRLKGEERPVNSEQERAQMLTALRMVDAVTVFEEDTPLDLISALMPQVLVKGADYTIDHVVGANIVMAANGRVVLARFTPGKSSSHILRRIKDYN